MNLRGSVTQVLAMEEVSQVGHARRLAQRLAEEIGFDTTDAGRVALVATELSTNILKHAGHGVMHVRTLPGKNADGIEIIAVDRGPGFDLRACLSDGFSTRGTQGTGLGSLSRQATVFDAYADARGAVVMARLYSQGGTVDDYRFGITQHALHNLPACGDAWHLAIRDGRVSALVIDGLGHGEEAQQAAEAGALAFAAQPFAAPEELLSDMHQAMTSSRGGAVAVAQFDPQTRGLKFAGIGNIGARLLSLEQSRGLASHPGIVGVQYRKAKVFDYTDAAGQLLIMHSDGLQSRWSLGDYPGLANRHPAVIAALLHRDFCRGRDDVTVLVIALGDTE